MGLSRNGRRDEDGWDKDLSEKRIGIVVVYTLNNCGLKKKTLRGQ